MPEKALSVETTDKSNIQDAVFWIAALLAVFWALGTRSLGGSEGRWAEIARGMILTGDYFHPFINHELYFDKPLLSYWLIVLVAKITGVLNEWTIRIPSALFALASLWAVRKLAATLWNREVARASGWILLTTLGFMFWARKADADMANMAAVILACAWFFSRRDKPGFYSYIIFYLICFLGAQMKGLTAVVIPFLALVPYFIPEKRWLKHFRISHFLAIAVAATIYYAPFKYAEITRDGKNGSSGTIQNIIEGDRASGLYMVFRENIERFFKPFDHKDPFYCYFIHLPRLFIPWSVVLAMALAATFMNYKDSYINVRWLLGAIVLIFLFFTISGSRRWYYILPVVPFCSMLTAVFIYSRSMEKLKNTALIITGLLLVTTSSLLLISPAAYFVAYHLEGFEATPFLLGSSVLTGALGLLPWVLKSRIPGFIEEITGLSKLFAPYAVSAFFLMGGLFCVIYTETDVYRTEKKFALELGAAASGIEPENICFFMKAPAKTVFYMARSEPLRVVNEKEVKSLDFDGNGFFVFQRKYIKYLPEKLARQLKGNILISEKFYNWERDSGKKLVAVEYSALAGQGATFPDKSPDNGNTLEEKHPNGIVNGNQEEENE